MTSISTRANLRFEKENRQLLNTWASILINKIKSERMGLDCGTGTIVNSTSFNSHFSELCICPKVNEWSGE